jgi:quercetin dioxygenase-like cupin family protein
MAYQGKILTNPYNGQALKFLQTAKDTKGKMLEMESTWQPHSKEPAAHYHPYQEENFAVITGELTVKINGLKRTLKAGDHLHIPINTVHAMWNESAGKTVVNWKVFPALNTENFLEMGMGLASDGKLNKNGMPPILQSALMANKYAKVFRLAHPPFLIQKILFTILSPFGYLAGYRSSYRQYID